jgi:hypothetical protein
MSTNAILIGLKKAPLIALLLCLYISLPSSVIFSEIGAEQFQPWHPGFAGWYDVAVLVPLAIWSALNSAGVGSKTLAFLGLLYGIICISILSNDFSDRMSCLFDATVYWARFSIPLVATKAVCRKFDRSTGEAIAFAMSLVLMASSFFVLRLQFGITNRLYGSGMTIGSFAQVMLATFILAISSRNKFMLSLSTLFLTLTFSRTSIALWIVAVVFLYFTMNGRNSINRSFLLVLSLCLFAGAVTVVVRDPDFQSLLEDRTDVESISTFSTRLAVWDYGLELIARGDVPVLGIGFSRTASKLMFFRPYLSGALENGYFPTFHSIILEYVIGLGVLSAPIFILVFRRLVGLWRSPFQSSFMLYALFLASQAFDFTFYRPKETVIWGVLLGIAEADWDTLRRLRSTNKFLNQTYRHPNPSVEPGQTPDGRELAT